MMYITPEKTIIVMSPTVNRAVYEWNAFKSKWSTIIKRTNKANRYIELLNGHKIYFKAKTEGQRAILGLHENVVSIDEFVMLKAESEDKE